MKPEKYICKAEINAGTSENPGTFPEKNAAGTIYKKRGARLSASIMCGDFLDLGRQLSEIEESTARFAELNPSCRTLIHCDITDNHFVPNLMLPP